MTYNTTDESGRQLTSKPQKCYCVALFLIGLLSHSIASELKLNGNKPPTSQENKNQICFNT